MQIFSYIEINLIALTILIIIFFNIRSKKERFLYDQKLFMLLLFFNAMILIFDTVMWVLNFKDGGTARVLNNVATTAYYMLNPVPCMLWSVYADFQIHKDEQRTKRLAAFLSIPVLINALLAVLSPFYKLLFYINRYNVYHRGKLFLIMGIICYFYFVYTFIQIIRNKSKIDRKQYLALIFFAFPPFISAIIQILYYGISVIWICMAFSLLIVFINIQNNQLYTDYLTGLYNRRQLDNYLTQKLNGITSKYLAGVMIDLDSFKQINDVYGHTAGDTALVCVADILKSSFRRNDFIARYGGDEFAVIMEIREKDELISIIDNLRKSTEQYNIESILPYQISLSIGYDIFDTKSGLTIQKFYKHIDKLMYEDKRGRDLNN
ncbi:MAG: hypothetical protein K0R50_76 [Eubacterium sp.]|nr:hypothetical protein [Eubacterium sp.]